MRSEALLALAGVCFLTEVFIVAPGLAAYVRSGRNHVTWRFDASTVSYSCQILGIHLSKAHPLKPRKP